MATADTKKIQTSWKGAKQSGRILYRCRRHKKAYFKISRTSKGDENWSPRKIGEIGGKITVFDWREGNDFWFE